MPQTGAHIEVTRWGPRDGDWRAGTKRPRHWSQGCGGRQPLPPQNKWQRLMMAQTRVAKFTHLAYLNTAAPRAPARAPQRLCPQYPRARNQWPLPSYRPLFPLLLPINAPLAPIQLSLRCPGKRLALQRCLSFVRSDALLACGPSCTAPCNSLSRAGLPYLACKGRNASRLRSGQLPSRPIASHAATALRSGSLTLTRTPAARD